MQNPIIELTKYANTDDYYWKSAIKERGWTDGAIKRFMGTHHATKPNPHSAKQPPMKLWLKASVEKAENSQEFKDWFAATINRRRKASQRMTEVMEAKRQETLEEFSQRITQSAESALSKIPSKKALEQQAKEHWVWAKNAHLEDRGNWDGFVSLADAEDADEGTLFRWACNYVRHELTNYEYLLDEMTGRVGREQAYETVKRCVSDAIRVKFYGAR